MPVRTITTVSDFETVKNTAELLICDFFATWCGPCKAIGPVFDKLSNNPDYAGATFARVDVDQLKPVAAACQISAMPTFQFFKKGQKVDELKGADPHALGSKIKQHAASLKSSAAPSLVKGMSSINDKLELKQLEVLNVTESSNVRNLVDPASKSVVKSDSDEQIMLYLPFIESVRLHSIVLRVNPDNLDNAPSKLHLFANRPNILSFDDIGGVPATQEIAEDSISYNEDGLALINLRFVKFQKVNSLVIFIEENQGGDDVTILRSIELLGEVCAANSSGVVQKIDHDHD